MRVLNFGFLATVGGLVGFTNGCGEGLDTEPVIAAGGLPPQITGGRVGTGGSTASPTAGSKSGGTGGSKSGTGQAGATGCPMNEPANSASCTLPSSGQLKCTYGTTTCNCEKSPTSGRLRWKCADGATGTGGRSSTSTGGKSGASGGTTGFGAPSGGSSGATSKAGGFGF